MGRFWALWNSQYQKKRSVPFYGGRGTRSARDVRQAQCLSTACRARPQSNRRSEAAPCRCVAKREDVYRIWQFRHRDLDLDNIFDGEKGGLSALETLFRHNDDKTRGVSFVSLEGEPTETQTVPDEQQEPLKFKVAVGRKFSFRHHMAQLWKVMSHSTLPHR